MIIGEGLNVWSHVEVHDGKRYDNGYYAHATNILKVAQFYYTLFDVIISDDKPEPPHGYHGFYFLENGEYAQMDIIKEIAKALFERGKVNSEEIVPLSEEELAKNPFYVRFVISSIETERDLTTRLPGCILGHELPVQRCPFTQYRLATHEDYSRSYC